MTFNLQNKFWSLVEYYRKNWEIERNDYIFLTMKMCKKNDINRGITIHIEMHILIILNYMLVDYLILKLGSKYYLMYTLDPSMCNFI